MKTTQEKIRSLSKNISIALTIGFAFMGFGAITGVLGLLLLLISNEEGKNVMIQSFPMMRVNGMDIVPSLGNVMIILTMLILYVLLVGTLLIILRSIFRDISRDGTPFNKIHTIRIKRVAILIVLLTFGGTLMGSISSAVTIGQASWEINLIGILVGVLIYCTALIYDYGCDLQEQSDETL